MKKIQNTLKLPKISIEQQRVVDLISNKKKVIVNGFPNSGKTYSIFYILENFKNKAKLSNKKVLILTFNHAINQNIKNNIESFDLNKNNSVDVYTIYGFMHYLSDNKFPGNNDLNKTNEFLAETNFNKNKLCYDLIIIDEFQDINDTMFDSIKIILENNKKTCENNDFNICLIGDKNQTIFAFDEYNASDYRYLMYADKIINFRNKPVMEKFETVNFTVTKKLPRKVGEFINENTNLLEKVNEKIICDEGYIKGFFDYWIYENENLLFNKMLSTISDFQNKEKKIGIVLFSDLYDKSNQIYEKYYQFIKKYNLKNVEIFNNYTIKGINKDIIFVMDFDNRLFEAKSNKLKNEFINNQIYVVLTRAYERTIVCQKYTNKICSIFKDSFLSTYNEFEYIGNEKVIKETFLSNNKLANIKDDLKKNNDNYCVTELLKNNNFSESIFDKNKKIVLREKQSSSKNENAFLDNIDAQLPTELLEIFNVQEMSANSLIGNFIESIFSNPNELYKQFDKKENAAEKMFNFYKKLINSQRNSELRLSYFEWYTNDIHNLIIKILKDKNISTNNFEIEKELSTKWYLSKTKQCNLSGRVDFIDHENKTVWEFKYVNDLKPKHLLQVLMYKFMIENEIENNKNTSIDKKLLNYKYKVLNIKTGQEFLMDYNNYEYFAEKVLNELVNDFINTKMLNKNTKEFIENHQINITSNLCNPYAILNMEYCDNRKQKRYSVVQLSIILTNGQTILDEYHTFIRPPRECEFNASRVLGLYKISKENIQNQRLFITEWNERIKNIFNKAQFFVFQNIATHISLLKEVNRYYGLGMQNISYCSFSKLMSNSTNIEDKLLKKLVATKLDKKIANEINAEAAEYENNYTSNIKTRIIYEVLKKETKNIPLLDYIFNNYKFNLIEFDNSEPAIYNPKLDPETFDKNEFKPLAFLKNDEVITNTTVLANLENTSTANVETNNNKNVEIEEVKEKSIPIVVVEKPIAIVTKSEPSEPEILISDRTITIDQPILKPKKEQVETVYIKEPQITPISSKTNEVAEIKYARPTTTIIVKEQFEEPKAAQNKPEEIFVKASETTFENVNNSQDDFVETKNIENQNKDSEVLKEEDKKIVDSIVSINDSKETNLDKENKPNEENDKPINKKKLFPYYIAGLALILAIWTIITIAIVCVFI